jgi:hypothetical protein
MRHQRLTFLFAAAVLFVVIPGASAVGAVTGTTAVPSTLVGAWNRNVKQADYNRYGQGQQGFLVGVWTIVVKKSGKTDFYIPSKDYPYKPGCIAKLTCFPDFSASFTGAGRRLTLSSTDSRVCTGKVTYNAKIAGASLSLKAMTETTKACTGLEALLEGVWKHTQT